MYTAHISIPLGIIIGLLASFVQSLGLTIQRKSHVQNQLLPEHRRLWLLGFAIFFSSNVLGSLVQIASLPVVILAPLGAVSLLWNALFARLILGDVFSPWMVLGTILIAGGAVLIAVFGIVPEPTRSLEDLLELFRRPTFVVYFSILGFIVFVCLAITHITEYSLIRKLAQISSPVISPPSTPSSTTLALKPSTLTIGLTTPIAETGTSTERTPLLDRKHTQISPAPSFIKTSNDTAPHFTNRARLILAISYASFSGIISGMCLLFAKSGVELLLLTLRGQNQFWRWQAWVLVLGLVVFALLQLWYLHKALILADPTLVCPSAFCFYNLSSIVNGLVYFDQFSLIPPLHLGLVILGIAILLAGVWVVSIQSGGGRAEAEVWSDTSEAGDGTEESAHTESDSHASESDVEESEDTLTNPALMKHEETRSDSNIYVLSASPEPNGRGLWSGSGRLPPSPRIQSTVSQPILPSQSGSQKSLSTNVPSQHLSSSRTRPHRRRPTFDAAHISSSSRHNHAQAPSYNQTNKSLSPPLVPLNPVSTLSSGFQIGLSPVSPGFAIVPRERGRRSSGLGLGAGPGFPDVVLDATSGELEAQRRRRTVSEGDVRKRALALASGRRSALEDIGGEGGEGHEEGASNLENPAGGKGKDRARDGRTSWTLLRSIFTER